MFYKIRRGIGNLLFWIPKIWGEGDYDYAFSLEHRKWSYERLYGHLSSGDCWHTHRPKRLLKLKIAILLLDRIIRDDYYTQYREWVEDNKPDRIDPATGYTIWESKFVRTSVLEMPANHSDILRRQDMEYLGKLEAKCIWNWWC